MVTVICILSDEKIGLNSFLIMKSVIKGVTNIEIRILESCCFMKSFYQFFIKINGSFILTQIVIGFSHFIKRFRLNRFFPFMIHNRLEKINS